MQLRGNSGHKREGKTGHRDKRLIIKVSALEASRGRVREQKVFRAAPCVQGSVPFRTHNGAGDSASHGGSWDLGGLADPGN